MDGTDEHWAVAPGQVGSADRAGEEGVSGEQQIFGGQVQADTALGVAGGVEDVADQASNSDDAAIVEGVVGREDFGSSHAEPAGLNVHELDQRQVALVVEDGRAGKLLQPRGARDVVDMRVGDEDLLHGEFVARKDGEDAWNVVAGVDDDGLA